MLYRNDMDCSLVMGGAGYLFNNSAWDWDSGLQREGVLYKHDPECCVVTGGAILYLTTRPEIGGVDFRGKVCCIGKSWFAVL